MENETFCRFVGTWKLVECIETDPQGNNIYPWGRDAIGYLIYTAEHIMSVQMMRKKRDITGVPQTCLDITKDYNAYFGRFEIDEALKTVTHVLEGNIDPQMIGIRKVRAYSFHEDKLALVTQKESLSIKITWQKVTA